MTRASVAFACESDCFEADDWSERLVDWCRASDLQTMVTPFVPTGPVNDVLGASRGALDDAGIRVVMLSRQYDRETWPFASRGYFKLKKQIGSVIERMQLESIAVPRELAANSDRPQQQDLLRSSG